MYQISPALVGRPWCRTTEPDRSERPQGPAVCIPSAVCSPCALSMTSMLFLFLFFFPRRLTPEHHRSSANPIECLDACAVVSTFFSPHFNYHQTPFYRHQAYILTTVMTYFYQNADESKFIFYSHHWTMSYRGEGMPCCEVSFVKYLCTLALGVCGFQKGLFVTRRFHISTYLIIQKVQNQKEIVLGVGEGGGGNSNFLWICTLLQLSWRFNMASIKFMS